MPILFDTLFELNQDVARNIVKILAPSEVFADLIEDNTDTSIAEETVLAAIKNANPFYYSVAIGFPFETDNFMSSRFSDGTFAVWYGSMDMLTTIYETTHHMIKSEMSLIEVKNIPVITRERVVYNVFCRGVLVDLTRKKKYYPELVSENYKTTQAIGKQLAEQGYPGLLSPAARNHKGINVNLFKQEILNQPTINCELIYQLFPNERIVKILKKNKTLLEINW